MLATPCTNLAPYTITKSFGNESILFAMPVIRGNFGRSSSETLKITIPQYIRNY